MISAAQMVPARTKRLNIEGDTIFSALPSIMVFWSISSELSMEISNAGWQSVPGIRRNYLRSSDFFPDHTVSRFYVDFIPVECLLYNTSLADARLAAARVF
eukprot:scaffold5947_cov83-Skeletonema_menzelii.AAC.1